MSLALHCDLPSCDSWVMVGPLDEHWIRVYEGDTLIGMYCDGWHAVQHMSSWAEPSKTVSIDGRDYE